MGYKAISVYIYDGEGILFRFFQENFLFFSAGSLYICSFFVEFVYVYVVNREFSLAIQREFCLRLTFSLPSKGAGGLAGSEGGDVVVTAW